MRLALLAPVTLLLACGGPQSTEPVAASATDETVTTEAASTASGCPMEAAGDDAPLPDIDCPMHPSNRRGDAPHAHGHHRPFDDMQAYAEFLERPDRDAWQRPDDVVTALATTGDDVVVDLGAGSGYFAFRFAETVARVDALDIEPEMVAFMQARVDELGTTNVVPGLVDPTLPDIAADATIVFVCDVFHHVENPRQWLAHIAGQLQPNAELVFVEFLEGELPVGPPATMRVTRGDLTEMAEAAGLTLMAFDDATLPYQYIATYTLAE